MSFFLTQRQIRDRTKTVTRRIGRSYKVGEMRQPVVKQRGLRKGEHVEKIGGPIRFTRVDYVRLNGPTLTFEDVAREGFPGMGPSDFLAMFRKSNTGKADMVSRIEFEYL